MCDFLQISTQLYYYHINHKPKSKNKFYLDMRVQKRVNDIFSSSNITGKGGVYGSRKIAHIYNLQVNTNNEQNLSPYQVLKVMKSLNITSNYHKRKNKKQTPTQSKDAKFASNILNRDYVQELNTVISCDLTYINTSNGVYYVCFIVDLWNREIIGIQITSRISISANYLNLCSFETK